MKIKTPSIPLDSLRKIDCYLCKCKTTFPNFVNLQLVDRKKLEKWAIQNISRKIQFPAFSCWICIKDAKYLNRTIDKDDEQAWWMGLRNPNEEDEDDDSELSDEDETDAEEAQDECKVKLINLTQNEISAICGKFDKIPARKHGKHDSKINCNYCNKGFQRHRLLLSHIKKKHKSVIICKFCDTLFTKKSIFDIHQQLCKTHKYDHVCTICEEGFKKLHHLNNHNLLKHMPVVCKYCHVEVGNKWSLIGHIKSQHKQFN